MVLLRLHRQYADEEHQLEEGAAEAAAAKRVAAGPKPLQSEPPEPRALSEPERLGLSPEDRFAVIGVLVLALIAGIVLMLVSYLDSVN